MWKRSLDKAIDDAAGEETAIRQFCKTNCDIVSRAISGRGPDDDQAAPDAGARMVVNISSANVPAFCEASQDKTNDKPYQNGYDSRKYRIGDAPLSDEPLKLREIVDRALPLKPNITADRIYFGAVEMNGAGMRFYGDVCLVLKKILDDTVILDRNSYDLVRPPIGDRIALRPEHEQDEARKHEARKLAGEWKQDLGTLAAIKAIQTLGARSRRYTTGQISRAVRDDEDYLEVLKVDSFGSSDLQEARFSAEDAGHDALMGDRLSSRPVPRMEAIMWRLRRSVAEDRLRRFGVRVRVVTSSGRTRD